MASFGDTLASIGQQMIANRRQREQAERQRRIDEEERKRNMLSDSLTQQNIEMNKMKLDETQFDDARKREALDALGKFQSKYDYGKNTVEPTNTALSELDFSKMETAPLPKQHGEIDEQGVLRKPDQSNIISELPDNQYSGVADAGNAVNDPLESFNRSTLAYADVGPVKAAREGLEKEQEIDIKKNKETSGGLGATVQKMRSEKWNQIASMPEGEEKQTAIDSYMMEFAPGTAYGLSPQGINRAATKAKTIEDTTRDSKVKTAEQIKTAQNLAPEKTPDTDRRDLTSAQNIIANLDDAAAKFKDDFATPYIGKTLKLKWLRQNDPAFNEFTSSLGLAMNEYRRQNFGTAQTNSEIQNFLDVLNTDVAIKPESFERQLRTLTNAMNRDYENKVQGLKGSNYVVPKTLEQPKTTTDSGSGVPTISSKAEYDKLPSGSQYISAKTGRKATKP